MKYRIKNIRREGWVETEDNLYRPAEDVAPIPVTDDKTGDIPHEITGEIYIIPDELSAPAEQADTIYFTPPPVSAQPPAPSTPTREIPLDQPLPRMEQPAEKKARFSFLKTKENKIMAGIICGFALLLIILIAIVLSLGGKNSDEGNAGTQNNNADHVHDFNTIILKDATCEEAGAVIEECSVCKYSAEGEQTVAALGHKWTTDKENTVEPTCDDAGELHKVCERCKTTEVQTQQAKGHTWIETATTEATCAEEGETKYRCTNCSEKKTEPIPKKDHEMSDPVRTEPTCDEDGKEVSTCKQCGKEEVKILEKLPHETTPATCTEAEICKNCGEEVSPATGHNYVDGVCTVCNTAEPKENNGNDVSAGTGIELTNGSIITISNSYTKIDDQIELSITLTVSQNYYDNPIYNEYITVFCPGSQREVAIDAKSNMLVDPASSTITEYFRVPFTESGDYIVRIYDGSVTHTCTLSVQE